MYANGLAGSKDGSKVFAVSTVGSYLHVYERKPSSGSLRQIEKVALPILGDNPSVNEETGAVMIAGHGHAFKYGAHSKDPKVASPSVVVKVSETSGESLFYGHRVMSYLYYLRIV
jgi:hypothetical protein